MTITETRQSEHWLCTQVTDVDELVARAHSILNQSKVCTLGTLACADTAPTLTPCFFAPTGDLNIAVVT